MRMMGLIVDSRYLNGMMSSPPSDLLLQDFD